jgi:hypothetical protein
MISYSFLVTEKTLLASVLINRFLITLNDLLRWYFRQAVLVNKKGAGEPIFEHDFPPGLDMVSDILHGPKAAERMEFELFSRFAAQIEVCGIPST